MNTCLYINFEYVARYPHGTRGSHMPRLASLRYADSGLYDILLLTTIKSKFRNDIYKN